MEETVPSPRLADVCPDLEELGDECFPVIHITQKPQHHVQIGSLDPAQDLDGNTAVVAELQKLVGSAGSRLLCWLGGDSFLCIHNSVIDGHAESDELQMLLPPSRIAIRSCLLGKKKSSNKLIIYAPCMAAIEFLGLIEEDEKKASSVEHQERAKLLRTRGNDEFSEGQFVLAGLFYSSAAAAAEANRQETELLLASSNHAQCMLKLQRFEEAIASCDKALSIDPHHSKSLFRKGQALSSLQLHSQALGVFKSSLKLSKDKMAVKQAIARTSILARQQETGDHDVLQYFLNGFDVKHAPEHCSEFVSDALEIRITEDGKGRGLFLTRDVEAGELLLVSNPVVATPRGSTDAFVVEALRSCGRSRRALKIINSLADSHSMTSLPSLQSFLSRCDDQSHEVMIDVGRVKRVLSLSSFQFKVSGKSMSTVFGLPGLINHSCLPNSSLEMIGGALFTRAARGLKSGEEITITYVESLNPLVYRSPRIREWGFECRCRRCEVEKLYDHLLNQIPDDVSISSPSREINEQIEACCRQFVGVEEVLRGLGEAISEEEKGMIRVGHVEAYSMVAAYGHLEMHHRGFEVVSEAELMRLMHDLVPGNMKSIVMAARLGLRMMEMRSASSESVGFLRDALAALMGSCGRGASVAKKVCQFLNDNRNVYKLAVRDNE